MWSSNLRANTLVAILLAGLVVFYLAASMSQATEHDRGASSGSTRERVAGGEESWPCGPIMLALESTDIDRNELARAGLRSTTVPISVTKQHRLGALYCFGDGMADRVDAVIVELIGHDQSVVGYWATRHDEASQDFALQQYVNELARHHRLNLRHESIRGALVSHDAARTPHPEAFADMGSKAHADIWKVIAEYSSNGRSGG